MRIGVCGAPESVKASIPDLAFIEPAVAALLCPRESEAEFAKRLAAAKACPLPIEAVNCLFPGDLKTTGPQTDFSAAEAYIQIVCRRAAQAGIKRIVFGSGGSRKVPEGFDKAKAADQFVEHMKRWGPHAARCKLMIVLEPLHKAETNIVNSVSEGAELVRRVDHPAIRLLADTFHMVREGEGPQAIRDAGKLIQHVHCAENVGRLPVGFGGEDQRPYFRALKDIGYDDRISIEANWKDFAAELPRAVAELKRQVETA